MFHDYSIHGAVVGYDRDALYDVNILLPVHLTYPFIRRLQTFKRYGLYNFANTKVHLTLLGTQGGWDSRHNVLRGWPEDIHTTYLEVGSPFAIPKLNGYYLWLHRSELRARWLLRVDDDSITDVAGLLAAADSMHGAAAVHLMSSPVEEHTRDLPHFRQYLETRGLELTGFRHEQESSLTSQCALEMVFADALAMDFLATLARTAQRTGDLCLAYAMSIARVPAVYNPFSTTEFSWDQLSTVGGPLCHVHHVDWEQPHFVSQWADLLQGHQAFR